MQLLNYCVHKSSLSGTTAILLYDLVFDVIIRTSYYDVKNLIVMKNGRGPLEALALAMWSVDRLCYTF